MCTLFLCTALLGTNPKSHHQQRCATAGALEEETAKFLLPASEMGRSKERIFHLCETYVFCFPKVCQAHLSEEEEDLEKGRWRVWVQLQGTTEAFVWYLGKNVNQSWPDSSVGLQHSKLCAAEDFELPLIMVQSIKSEQLNSLTAFGKGLLTTIFWISQSLCPWDSPNLRSFAPSKNSTRCRFHGLSLQGLSLSLCTAFICAFANPTIFYNTFQFSL